MTLATGEIYQGIFSVTETSEEKVYEITVRSENENLLHILEQREGKISLKIQ